MSSIIFWDVLTIWGAWRFGYRSSGVVSIRFLRGEKPSSLSSPLDLMAENIQKAIEAYSAGEGRPLAELPIDCKMGTPFQRQVWAVLETIPYGERRSYKVIAQAIGRPKAVRAVGAACGANPLPLRIPCHRVVQSSGALGGYAFGAPLKQQLLDHEQGEG